ncbi:hypothetical protein PG987_012476 [Apiospora arundinis]
MASRRQRSPTTLTSSNASMVPIHGLDATISGLNGSLESHTPPLRGAHLVDLLDFLNTHFDTLRLILKPKDADKATAASFPANFEELREHVSAKLYLLLGIHAFDLFLRPESDNAKELWDTLMKGVSFRTAMSENHGRWAKVNPNKIYALFEEAGMHYHFSQPGHAETNIGYGVPLWMAHAVPRSPEFQSRPKDDTGEAVSIEEAETPTRSRRSSSSTSPEWPNEIHDGGMGVYQLMESFQMMGFRRPPLRELHPSDGNLHLLKDKTDFESFTPQVYSISEFERLQEFRELSAHKETPSLASLDLHPTSCRPIQEDPRGRQDGHHKSAGLLFSDTLPLALVTIPRHAQLLNSISDDDLLITEKEWPSAEADQFQKRFAYESYSPAGAKSFLTDLSRLPDDKLALGDDILDAMICKFVNDFQRQDTGPISRTSAINKLIVTINAYITKDHVAHDIDNPWPKEDFCEMARYFLSEQGILEFSQEEHAAGTAATATPTKQMSLARECQVILKGLREAHCKVEDHPSGARGKKPSGTASRSPVTNAGKNVGKQSARPKKAMIFFR